jgi:Domain of unknown function (DUF5753)
VLGFASQAGVSGWRLAAACGATHKEAGAHVGLLEAFAIAGLAGDAPGIAYLESPDEGQTSRDPVRVAKIVLKFETLRSEALPRGASRDLILKVAGEYGRDLEEVQLQRR